MSTLLRSFTQRPGLLFYLDTSAVFPLALARAGSTNAKELERARDVASFLASASRNTSRGICSVLVLEEIAAFIRRESQTPVLLREGYDSWREFRNAAPAASEIEGKAIGERTSAAMQHKASKGEFTGGSAPYGYELAADGVALVPVTAEQAVIAEVRALRSSGLSLRKVAKALEAKGVKARSGRRFAAAQVARMVAA